MRLDADSGTGVKKFTVSGILAVAILMTLAAFGQGQAVLTGTVQGTVTDAKGAGIGGAKVIITSKSSSQKVTVNADSSGAYKSGALEEGDYVVRVSVLGYASASVTVNVKAATVTTANLATQTVPIPGVVVTEEVENVPVNGRNFLDYARLEPRVQNQDGTFDPTKGGFSAVSIGSRFGRATSIEVDGLSVRDESVGATTQNIPASAIQQLRVADLAIGISPDQSSSGLVDIVTRSGTNDLHGELIGLYRDGAVASASLPGGGTPPWQRQQFGGNAGGALIKDKLFWFISAERNRQDAQNPVLEGEQLASRSMRIREPFRELESTDRLDYKISDTAHVFYRFSYDQNSDVSPFENGPSLQPFLNRTNTPSHVIGLDFGTGSFMHSIRLQYLKFRNGISDSSSEVVGPGNPEPLATIDIGGGATSQCQAGSIFCSGPSFLAPQQTYQSNHEYKYDGSHIWQTHDFHYGASFNHILNGGYASLDGLAPTLADEGTIPLPAGVLGSNGSVADPLDYPVEWSVIGNGQGFTTATPEFGLPRGGRTDDRFVAYFADSWKVKRNLTVTYGVQWLRENGKTDSDLAAVPQLNAWQTGLGNRVRVPEANFAPRLGIAWDPNSSGKTSVRAGIGLFYDNTIFNNAFFDSPLRLQQGQFLSTPAVCVGGAPGSIQWPSNAGVTGAPVANGAGIVNPDGTVSPTWCGDSIRMAAPLAIMLQQAYQSATAAAGAGSNPSFIGNTGAFAAPNQNGLSLLAPNYQTPRTVQMSLGFQHEMGNGLVLNLDLVRSVTTRTLLGIDVNHGGNVNTFNLGSALLDRDATQLANGCAAGTNQVSCMIAKLGPSGALNAYGSGGIGGPAQVTGGAPCPTCAFPGFHPNLGVNVMEFPEARSVYNGVDISLRQQLSTFFVPGVSRANFLLAYSRSRNVGQSNDVDFASPASDYSNPNRFTGPNGLDRANQFSLGGYFDLPRLFRLSMIGHFYSPLPATLRFQQNAGGAEVLVTDWTGDGTTGDIIPGSNAGAYMRSIKASGLQAFIKSYNTNLANNATPAGNALINGGVFSLQDLRAMGGVLQPLADPVQDPSGLGWLRTLDVRLSWIYKFQDRVTIEPSVGIFNMFNFANFDLPGNTQSGVLNFGSGSISQPFTFNQPQSTVGGTSANLTAASGRTNRASLQSGTNALGAPRALEWGLKISF